MDYTKLLRKIKPEDQVSGDPGLELRAGIIDSAGTAGTYNVLMSGVLVPNVPRLQGAGVQVGAVVQMLSYRGSLLIIGQPAVGSAGQSPGLGLWARGQITSTSPTIGTTLAATITTNTVTFVKNRVYEVRTHGGVSSTVANGYLDLRAYRAGPATQIAEFFRIPAPVTGAAFNASARGIYFTMAANVLGAVALYAAASPASAVTHVGTTGTPRNVEVFDVGDISQFAGVTVW